MARMVGQTGSWLWWLAGALCALAFGRAVVAGEATEKYGVRPRPPADQPAVTEEQKRQAGKLVADYLAPVPPAEPTAEQKAAIDKLVQDLGSADFKVRAAAAVVAIERAAH
jgi:hypothetical protein